MADASESSAPDAPTLPPQPMPTNDIIKAALTDEPQTSEMVHQSIVALAAGKYVPPSLNTVQSALSTRGEKMGKKVKAGKRTGWVKFGEGETASEVAKANKKKTARPTKLSQKRKAEEAAKEAKGKAKADKPVDFAALRVRTEEILAQPMSAFALFGLSQRGALKKQKTSTTVKEVVKAIGERWLLLGDAERARYEEMAQEEPRYLEQRSAKKATAAAAAAVAKQQAAAAAQDAAAAAAAAAADNRAEDDPDDPDVHELQEQGVPEGGGASAMDMEEPIDVMS